MYSGSNCTLLELKDRANLKEHEDGHSSNCTLLELKVELTDKDGNAVPVLIVPYWN